MSESKAKAKTVEYMRREVLARIFFDMKRAKITRNQLADRMAERGYSKRTVYRFFERDERGLFRSDVPVDDGQIIIDVLNMLLEEKGCSPLPYTARWTDVKDDEVNRVYEAMSELVMYIMPMLTAQQITDLARIAWSFYENDYQERPEFFESDLYPCERRYPPAWKNWERLPASEQERLTTMYEEAKTRAEKDMSRHAEAERLHEKAEIIAGGMKPDNSEIKPAEGWAAWEQSKEADTTDRLDRLQWWYDACPGGEEYAGERQHLKEQIDKLEAEERTAKQGN